MSLLGSIPTVGPSLVAGSDELGVTGREVGPVGLLRVGAAASILFRVVSHPELMGPICFGIALEIVHLRWILWTQWTCRRCGDAHIDCGCKPDWLKHLL
jgi:hypothetical protein